MCAVMMQSVDVVWSEREAGGMFSVAVEQGRSAGMLRLLVVCSAHPGADWSTGGRCGGRCARSDCSSSGVGVCGVCGLGQVDAPLSGSNDPDQVIASSFPDTGDTAALAGRAEGWR
uniref:Uncharacterized protein n=1 Tax=Knipowitschia caucasica TaxID=637954 RepID=A0AAV2L867_KNICA